MLIFQDEEHVRKKDFGRLNYRVPWKLWYKWNDRRRKFDTWVRDSEEKNVERGHSSVSAKKWLTTIVRLLDSRGQWHFHLDTKDSLLWNLRRDVSWHFRCDGKLTQCFKSLDKLISIVFTVEYFVILWQVMSLQKKIQLLLYLCHVSNYRKIWSSNVVKYRIRVCTDNHVLHEK